MKETTLSSQYVYKGFLKVRKDRVMLENGVEANREVLDLPGACAIIPVAQDGRIILIRQFRYAVSREVLELPAGRIDPNEEPIVCAGRELQEEIGFAAGNLKPIGDFYPSVGCMNEKLHIFLAENLYEKSLPCDDEEHIEPVYKTRDELLDMIRKGEIQDAKTIIGLLRYFFGI